MAIGAMGAVNIASSLGTAAGNAAGNSSASSGQGGAGIGFNLLGAPGDPGGVVMGIINKRLARKEGIRQFDKQMELQNQQVESMSLVNAEEKRKQEWARKVRKLMLRGGA